MICILSDESDPYFHLAAEEYLLRNTKQEAFMLWQSKPAVVVGKHQNVLAEMNYHFVKKEGILVARRLSGGGAVYHDQGNLNFTFIRVGEPGKLVNFSIFIAPVIEFLRQQGVMAHEGEKHEILVHDKKISGNAEHVYRNRVLHHGTILYRANLEKLQNSLRHGGGRFIDKAVQSNRASVMNLATLLRFAPPVKEFAKQFMNYIRDESGGYDYAFSEDEHKIIVQLATEKYATWDWIYGWSPDYHYFGPKRAEPKIEIALHVRRGIITECVFRSPEYPEVLTSAFADTLINAPHNENIIRHHLLESKLAEILTDKEREIIVNSFFD
jgi:lipoate-protein ligase A